MPAARVNQYERAFRAWPLLTATAAKRSTISYVKLAEYLHIHPRADPLRAGSHPRLVSAREEAAADDPGREPALASSRRGLHRVGRHDLEEGYQAHS
jgi:hypothetical protein